MGELMILAQFVTAASTGVIALVAVVFMMKALPILERMEKQTKP